MTENDSVLEKVNSDANKINEEVKDPENDDKESDTKKTAVEIGDLPPPPSKDQILGKCYNLRGSHFLYF